MAPPVSFAAGLKRPPAAALACVPGLEHGAAPRAVVPLPGGTVNDVYRIDTADGRFVLRVDGPAWRRPGVDREREALLHTAAAAAGLAPRILRRCPQRGVLVTQYLSGTPWSSAQFARAASLAQLGERLAQLHALAVPPIAPFDPLELADAYLAAARRRARAPADFDAATAAAVRARLVAAVRRVAAAERPAVPVHGDLVHGNLLQGECLWLLDFEYAQRADPVYDAGCVLAYYPAARAAIGALLAATFPGRPVAAAELEAAASVHRTLAWLWHLARGEHAAAP
ncbi:MAG: phosphotransferase [Gammaproteobacteria bacterium]|nr:phosphotransferase [Gammaproteobacteria bacterium]